jgi:hypothetical protein
MPPQTGVSRLDDLEKRVTRLEELPACIDDLTLQVSQLRAEMRDEFSAVRSEMAAGFAALEARLGAKFEARLEASLEAKTDGLATQMRILHEDVIARIALLQEGLTATAKRRPKKK